MRIILDTNIFVSDLKLASPAFRVLLASFRDAGHTMHIPKVVVAELLNKFGEEYDKVTNQMNRLGLTEFSLLPDGFSIANTEEAVNAYESYLHTHFLRFAEVLNIPSVNHQTLLERALARSKPFRSTDTGGYRDALVWYSLLELASRDRIRLAFISSNKKDFADTEDPHLLHSDLLADLEDLEIEKDRISYFHSLDEFLRLEVTPHLEQLDEIQKMLREGSLPNLNLESFMEERFFEFAGSMEFAGNELGLPTEFEMVHIVGVEQVGEISDVGARRISDDLIYVEFYAKLEAAIDVFVFKGDYYLIDEEIRPQIINPDWNDHYFLTSTSASLGVDVSLVIDGESFGVKALSIDSIKNLDTDKYSY